MALSIVMPFGSWARTGPRNYELDGVQIPHENGQFWGKGAPIVYRLSAVSCAAMAEPIDLPFGLWTRVGQRKHMFSHIRQVAPMCPHGRQILLNRPLRWRCGLTGMSNYFEHLLLYFQYELHVMCGCSSGPVLVNSRSRYQCKMF